MNINTFGIDIFVFALCSYIVIELCKAFSKNEDEKRMLNKLFSKFIISIILFSIIVEITLPINNIVMAFQVIFITITLLTILSIFTSTKDDKFIIPIELLLIFPAIIGLMIVTLLTPIIIPATVGIMVVVFVKLSECEKHGRYRINIYR